MSDDRSRSALQALRVRVAEMETPGRRGFGVLPFGLASLDQRLPGGGLARGALHEVAGAGPEAGDGAAATLFAAGVLARTEGAVLWCVKRRDLFAPALAQAGLTPERVIFVEAGDEAGVLAAFEEALRHPGLGGAAAELSDLGMTASRRLHLAAESTGALGLIVRRWRRSRPAAMETPNAAATRWRIAPLPAVPLQVDGRLIAGLGRPHWRLDLTRCRGGEGFSLEVEACDGEGRLALPALLADGSAAAHAPLQAAS